MRAFRFVVVTVATLVGCSTQKDTGGQAPSAAPYQVIKTSGMISASQGGTLQLDNGTAVTFPPGALRNDTNVTLSRLEDRASDPEALLAAVKLEPDNLALEQPATLTLKYTQVPAEGEASLVLVSVSKANLHRVSGEVSPYAVVPSANDPSTKTVQADITHFSWFSLNPLPLVHIALELPGKYLHNGDLLYALTGGVSNTDATAFPMHVGVFVEDATHDAVVESTLPDEDCTPNYFQGVDKHGYVGTNVGGNKGLNGFKTLCGGHVFLGARRPRGDHSVDTRATVASSALSQLHSPYGIASLNNPGWGQGNIGPFTFGTGVSCVELAEDAWEAAGVNISLIPDELLSPHDQFLRTTPVIDIKARAGEEIRIPIIGASRVGESFQYLTGKLSSAPGSREPMVLAVTAEPNVFAQGRASLEPPSSPQALEDLVFRPTNDDAAETTQFTFKLTEPKLSAEARPASLFVQVEKTDVAANCFDTNNVGRPDPDHDSVYDGDFIGTAGTKPVKVGASARVTRPSSFVEPGAPMKFTFQTAAGGAPAIYCQIAAVPPGQFVPGATVGATFPAGSAETYCKTNCPQDFLPVATDLATSGNVTFAASNDCHGMTVTVAAQGPRCQVTGTFTGAWDSR